MQPSPKPTIEFLRKIRSFVRRDGRMTAGQSFAFETYWPKFGLQVADGICDFSKQFQREAPRVLEIGFGAGASLLAVAKAHPECDFIGIEMHKPGIGALLMHMELQQANTIRIYYADAVEVLSHCIADESLDVIQIFFPDPWQKRKHHKRRLIQPAFVTLLASKLKVGGSLHLATDWEHYAHAMMQIVSAEPRLANLAGENEFATRSTQRPIVTKFELRGEKSGRRTFELQFVKRTAGHSCHK